MRNGRQKRSLRYLLPLILLWLLQGSISGAHGQQYRFDRANELLQQQRVEEAFEVYRSIEMGGYHSGELYFNMGIASMYQDSLGLAKYYFMQSLQYPETRDRAEQSMRFVNEQFERHSAVLPKLPWERFFEWIDELFGAAALLLFGILMLNIGVGGVIGSWFTGKAAVWLKRSGYTAVVISIVLIGTSFYLDYLEVRFDTAVMVDRQTAVYEQPSATSTSVSTAYEGFTMTVDNKRSTEEEEWYYVRLQNGMNGWLEKSSVRTF